MADRPHLICVIGPTASGKSARAVSLAQERGGEVISVDSRQVYRMLDIGTEKTLPQERAGIPHHLIDIQDPRIPYSAGEFVRDAALLVDEIRERGKTPILAGGTHFYFDALLYGLPPETPPDAVYRQELEAFSNDELFERVRTLDPLRAETLDPQNRRRLIRALEILNAHGEVPARLQKPTYDVEWIVVDPGREALRERIEKRLESALERGLIDEVSKVRAYVGDERLNELGLEYRIVGEYLRGERDEASLMPALCAKLYQYARRQRAWIRKITATARTLRSEPR